MVVAPKRFLIARIVEMIHGPLVLGGKGRSVPECFLPAVIPAQLGLKILNFQLKNVLYQCVDIRIIVIEGVAVHSALFRNVFNGNFIQRAFVQQLDKGPPDGIFCLLRHSPLLLKQISFFISIIHGNRTSLKCEFLTKSLGL